MLRHVERQCALAQQRCDAAAAAGCHAGRYEFRCRQVAGILGTSQAVVNIVDTRDALVAEWPPERLELWLEKCSTVQRANAANMFVGFDVTWRTMDEYTAQAVGSVLASPRASHSPRVSTVTGGGVMKSLRSMFGGKTQVSSPRSVLHDSAVNSWRTEESVAMITDKADNREASGRRDAENVRPKTTTEGEKPSTAVRSPKFVRMSVE